MQFRFASLFAVVAAIGVSAQLQINTPTNVVQCLPQLLTWSGGTGPYFVTLVVDVSVLPGGQPSAAALVDFGEQTGTQLTWVVNIAAGTSVGLSIRDQTGTVASSAPFSIGSGSDSSCVGKPVSTVSGSSTGAATGASTGSTSPASTTSGSSGSTTAAGSSSTTSASATRTSATGSGSSTATTSGNSSTSSSAAKPFAQIGSAGVIGAVVAAIFA